MSDLVAMAWKNSKSSSSLIVLMITYSSIISVEKAPGLTSSGGHFQFLWSRIAITDSVWNSCIFNISLFQPHKGLFPQQNYHFQLLVVSLIGPISKFAFFQSVKRCLCQNSQRLLVLEPQHDFLGHS